MAEEELMVIMYNTNKFAILHSKLANVINNLNAIGIENVHIDYVWCFPNIHLVYDLAEYYKLDDVSTVFKIYKALKTKEKKGIIRDIMMYFNMHTIPQTTCKTQSKY